MYNDVPATYFGRFLTGHHQVGIQCQRNYLPTINIDICISVSTQKGGGDGTRSRLQNTGRVVRPVLEIHTGCSRRNVPKFGRVFLMLNYTDITQNIYIQS